MCTPTFNYEFSLFFDHTTEGSLGMQNVFLGLLNSLNPSAKHNCIPVCSHDQKDNFKATKVVAKETISQINDLVLTPPIFNLSVDHKIDSLETYSYPHTKQPNFKLFSFCNSCHKNTLICMCVEEAEFFCADPHCSKKFETAALLETHKRLDHTK